MRPHPLAPLLCFASAFAFIAAGCQSELLHGLDERQANEVVAELAHRGVSAEKLADDGMQRFKVRVAAADAGRARDALAARDLPRTGARGVSETFADPGLFPSPQAERARLQAALAVDLERTLSLVPDVAMARVHLALGDDGTIQELGHESRITASVLLRTRAPLALPGDEIRKLVAAAVPGLDAADVILAYAPEPPASDTPREAFVHVGPIALAASSQKPALAIAAAILAALMALAAAVLVLFLRLRALRNDRPHS